MDPATLAMIGGAIVLVHIIRRSARPAPSAPPPAPEPEPPSFDYVYGSRGLRPAITQSGMAEEREEAEAAAREESEEGGADEESDRFVFLSRAEQALATSAAPDVVGAGTGYIRRPSSDGTITVRPSYQSGTAPSLSQIRWGYLHPQRKK